MAMQIQNAHGTSEKTCACESWLDHWEKFSGQKAKFCGVTSCLNKDVVGAHVRRLGSNETYIYPLCNEHNQDDAVLEVADYNALVSANPAVTCERRR